MIINEVLFRIISNYRKFFTKTSWKIFFWKFPIFKVFFYSWWCEGMQDIWQFLVYFSVVSVSKTRKLEQIFSDNAVQIIDYNFLTQISMKKTKAQKTINQISWFFHSFRFWNLKLFFGQKYMLQYNFTGYFSKWISMVEITLSIVDY